MKYEIFAVMVCFSSFSYAQSGAERELQKAINQTGSPCHQVTQVFHNGNDREGSMHFSVACSGGQTYAVMVNRDGTGKVLECSILNKISGGAGKKGSCFVKF